MVPWEPMFSQSVKRNGFVLLLKLLWACFFLKIKKGRISGQVKVNVDNIAPKGTVKGGNSYYLEKEQLGAFVYSEGAEQVNFLLIEI